jgi:hypothetical protein
MGAGISGEDSAMIATITRVRMLMTTRSPVVDLADKKAMDANGAALIRIMLRSYPSERLDFELAEDMGSRHPATPQIQFTSEEIAAVQNYLAGDQR